MKIQEKFRYLLVYFEVAMEIYCLLINLMKNKYILQKKKFSDEWHCFTFLQISCNV